MTPEVTPDARPDARPEAAVMGAAERELLHEGLRWALVLRLTVTAVASVVSLLLEPGPLPLVNLALVVVLNAWNLGYAFLRLCAGPGLARLLVPLDVLVICAVCLTQVWTVAHQPSVQDNAMLLNWVLVAAEISVVAYPWMTGALGLSVIAVLVTVAYVVGASIAEPGRVLGGSLLHTWLLVEAALSWGLYRMVRRRALTADEQVAREQRLRVQAAVATARRVDENEYLATLHDTASATLLMVGAGVIAGHQEWLGEQAARDLAAISGPAVVTGSDVDLIEMLREVVEQTPLRVRWHGAESLPVPAVDAVMLCHGAREALTNVLRHAGTDEADMAVAVHDGVVAVEITDRGRGFDPAAVSGHRHGVARSLVQRMARIGGSATVSSEPGVGTTVRMTCSLTASAPPPEDHTAFIATNYHKGLSWAVQVMSVVIIVALDLPKLLTHLDAYRSIPAQFVVFAGFLGVGAVAAVATWRDRPLGRWRWPLVALVFALSVLGTQTVGAGDRFGVAHWSEGDAGWWVAVLVLDCRVVLFLAALVAQYVLTFTHTIAVGHGPVTVAGMVNATLLVFSYQLAVGMIAAVLRGIAVLAARAARERERLRTAEVVQRQLHDDRRDRFAGLADTTVPLLDGLASGRLDPADAAVRRACAVEATRMRRLFVETAAESDALLQELRACIELAERNGVSVSFAEYGNRPDIPTQARRTLTEPAVAVLATASGRVRLTMAGTDETVTVSVVSGRTPYPVPAPERDGVLTSVVEEGDRLWIQTTWRGGT